VDDKTKDIIQCISDIVNFSNELNIKSYIWGGYVQDIIEGKILREHNDIDVFIENLDTNIKYLEEKFTNNGYNFLFSNEIQMLKLNKNGIKATINPVKFINKTAIWNHIGEQGFICFPKDWLDIDYREFYGIKVMTAGIKFEYCVRKIIKYMNPAWLNRIREKDIIANEYYQKKLEEEKIEPAELLDKIWGYNPYWLKDGYNGYEAPVLVIGKDYK